MKSSPPRSFRFLPTALCILGSVVAYQAQAAGLWFNPGGPVYISGGDYSWDDAVWSTSSGGTPGYWIQGSFAQFGIGSSGTSYTVTMHNDEQMAGLYESVAGVSLTLNAAGAGTLDVVSGDQGFMVKGTVVINAPISGSGGVAPQYGGNLYLYGQNTYTGGTTFGYYGYPFTYFNNNNSFGSGPLIFKNGVGGYQPLLATGGTTITLANAFQIQSSGQGINFAGGANTPVVSTGNWSLGVNNLYLRNSGGTSSPLTLAGVISGSASLALSANNNSTIVLSGANTYSGTTTVGKGGTAVTLRLGAANTLASSSSLVMAGGILDPGGFHHTMGSTTLSLTDNSIIDFGAGAAELNFANSSASAWTSGKVLNLLNWDPEQDALRFGTDATGLTAVQLAQIEFNGDASTLGSASLDPSGFVVVPEPSVAALGLLGALGAWMARRKKA